MLGIIGGSGLSSLDRLEAIEERMLTTRCGIPSSTLNIGKLNGKEVAFLARHGRPHCIPPHLVNYRANLLALQQAGVTEIIAVNAVGGIADSCETGALCLPDQIIDYTWGREHTFYADNSEVEHIDFTWPYSEKIRRRLLSAATQINQSLLDGGVYGATQGPRLETAAEIRQLHRDGCAIVGMTGMPEAALARELGIDYACLAVVVNKAAGLSAGPITMQAIEDAMQQSMARVEKLLAAYCR